MPKLKDLSLVTIGCLIAATGLNTMLMDNNIVSGGIGGLAISMNKLFGWNPGNFALLANIPLLILCYIFLGRTTLLKTLYGAWIYPIFIKLTEKLPTLTHQPLLAALFGGVILGVGLGLVFLGNSSTGGTAIPTQIIHKYSPLSLGVVMTIVDGLVVATGLVAFDIDTVLYSILSLLTISYVVDIVTSGFQSSKNVMIVSQQHQKIKNHITTDLDRGVTEIPILGGYTGQERLMLMTTISSLEFPKLQKEILKLDETAFIIVIPATQVMGRGFSLTKQHQLKEDDLIPPM